MRDKAHFNGSRKLFVSIYHHLLPIYQYSLQVIEVVEVVEIVEIVEIAEAEAEMVEAEAEVEIVEVDQNQSTKRNMILVKKITYPPNHAKGGIHPLRN